MIREENDFRISVAGAQEKTALLRIGNDWCIPKGITPTTHIIKLPIGEIRQPNATLDLSQSVDNEYYCLLLAKELGLNVPDAEIIKAGRVRALAVKRFDRRWNTERTVLLRLPQEDMCQTFGLPSSVKYESDGGPGIAQIMAFLMGSSEALKDRYDFMKFQVFQWLIGATDGHAKNFSVFIQAGGSYRLTPFYDIISAFPVLGGTGIHISDLKHMGFWSLLMSRTIMNRQRLDSPLVYVGAHNVYYVKLPVKVLYFTIHIHTQINQYVVISDFPPVSVEKFNLCSVMAHHRP